MAKCHSLAAGPEIKLWCYFMSLCKASCVPVPENKREAPSLPTPVFPAGIGNMAWGLVYFFNLPG